jgi:hypothetical protein
LHTEARHAPSLVYAYPRFCCTAQLQVGCTMFDLVTHVKALLEDPAQGLQIKWCKPGAQGLR